MTIDLKAKTDADIEKLIGSWSDELKDRAERIVAGRTELRDRAQRRVDDAIAEIRLIAQKANVDLRDLVREKKAAKKVKQIKQLQAAVVGALYVDPESGARHKFGSGKEPNWMRRLREAGTLPEPEIGTEIRKAG